MLTHRRTTITARSVAGGGWLISGERNGTAWVEMATCCGGAAQDRERIACLGRSLILSSSRISEPAGDNEQPFLNLPMGGMFLHASPTVSILDRDEVVRAVFEGPDAWDTAAIERAARAVSPAAPPAPSGPTPRTR